MAISLQKKVKKEEKPNTCKTLITTENISLNSPTSYFLSITIPQPKVKIKVPKVLVKAMQRKKKGSCTDLNADDMDKKKKNKKRRHWDRTHMNIKRVGSVFANVFRHKKSPSSQQNQCSPSHDVGTSENNSQIVVSKSCSFKEILKLDDHDHRGNKKKKKNMQVILKVKPSLKSSVSLSSYFSRRKKARGNSCVKGEEVDPSSIHEDELCKKRILMGEKCKPLNASGVLHYDRNGVILPELIDQ